MQHRFGKQCWSGEATRDIGRGTSEGEAAPHRALVVAEAGLGEASVSEAGMNSRLTVNGPPTQFMFSFYFMESKNVLQIWENGIKIFDLGTFFVTAE